MLLPMACCAAQPVGNAHRRTARQRPSLQRYAVRHVASACWDVAAGGSVLCTRLVGMPKPHLMVPSHCSATRSGL